MGAHPGEEARQELNIHESYSRPPRAGAASMKVITGRYLIVSFIFLCIAQF